jgi:cell division transport system permease protein
MRNFRNAPSDFPFEKSTSSRVLPWVIGALIYLATLAVLGCQGVYRTIETWHIALSEHITIEIPVTQKTKEAALDQLQKFLLTLEKEPWLLKAEIMPEDRVQELIAAWIGDISLTKTLELPILVDLHVAPGQQVSLEGVEEQVTSVFPEAALHNHAEWYNSVLRYASFAQFFSITLALLTAMIVMGTVVFATHSSLVVHQRIINILQLIGATDTYVAAQLEKRTLRMALFASCLAITASVVTLFTFRTASNDILSFGGQEWGIVIFIPICMVAALICVTRLTVLWSLYKKDLNITL